MPGYNNQSPMRWLSEPTRDRAAHRCTFASIGHVWEGQGGSRKEAEFKVKVLKEQPASRNIELI